MKHFLRVLIVAALFVAPSVFACAACAGGKTDDNLAQGMNAGIFVLLGVVGVVLGGTASVGIYLVRRASRMSQLAGSEPVVQPTI